MSALLAELYRGLEARPYRYRSSVRTLDHARTCELCGDTIAPRVQHAVHDRASGDAIVRRVIVGPVPTSIDGLDACPGCVDAFLSHRQAGRV